VLALIRFHSVMNTVIEVFGKKTGGVKINLLLFKCSLYVTDSHIVT